MEFWPIFDIFHGLRPYLCSKAQDLGFHKQPTHRRRDDEPFFYSGVDRSWLGMAQKWSILDQKWPNMAGLSTLQSGPKGPKRDQNGQPKSFWTFGTLLDNFKQELIFCSEAPLQNPILSIWGKNIKPGVDPSMWLCRSLFLTLILTGQAGLTSHHIGYDLSNGKSLLVQSSAMVPLSDPRLPAQSSKFWLLSI